MTGMSPLAALSRWVRGLSMVLGMSLLVGFVAIHAFGARYGASDDHGLRDVDATLASAITEQASIGRLCREHPVLSDVVLFQRTGRSGVVVLRWDEAVAAATAQRGTIRRYCT